MDIEAKYEGGHLFAGTEENQWVFISYGEDVEETFSAYQEEIEAILGEDIEDFSQWFFENDGDFTFRFVEGGTVQADGIDATDLDIWVGLIDAGDEEKVKAYFDLFGTSTYYSNDFNSIVVYESTEQIGQSLLEGEIPDHLYNYLILMHTGMISCRVGIMLRVQMVTFTFDSHEY